MQANSLAVRNRRDNNRVPQVKVGRRNILGWMVALLLLAVAPHPIHADGRSETQQALEKLRRELTATPGRLEVWSDYLQLPKLDGLMANPDAPDAKSLAEVRSQLARVKQPPESYLLSDVAKSFDRMLVLAGGEPAAANQVRQELEALDQWLETRPSQADRWREFVSMDELDRQFLAGAKPDRETVRQLRDKFVSDTPGLDANRFVSTRVALDDWLAINDGTADPEGLATRALDEVTQSFGRDRRRRATWDKVLGLRTIRQALAADGMTDEQQLRQWRDQFAVEANDSSRARFADLGRALSNWIAEIQNPLSEPLAQEIRASKMDYAVPSSSALQVARQQLIDSVNTLRRWLNSAPRERREGWTKFTRLAELEHELHNSPLNYNRLRKSYAIFNSGEIGLEKKAFADVRRALKNNVDMLQLTEAQPAAVSAAIRSVNRDLTALDGFLQRGGSEKQANWRRYLKWDELQKRLRDDRLAPGGLRDIYRKFTAKQKGLNLPAFDQVARGMQRLDNAMRMVRSKSPEDRFAENLEDLAIAVQRWQSDLDNNAAQTITQQLQWLRSTGQLTHIVNRVEQRFNRPNLRMTITGRIVNELLADTRCQRDPVAMCLFGAWVTGTTDSQVGYQAQLVPSPNSAVLELVVGGSAYTRAVGRQRRVGVHTRANTGLWARKQLIFTASGLQATPTMASARTSQRICGVEVNRLFFRRIIGRLALRRARRLKPCAEGVADCQARTKLARQMDQQSAPMIDDANRRLRDAEARMRKQGVYPDVVHVRSTSEHVIIDALKTDGRFVSASTNPPFISMGNDATIQVHQSTLNNILARRFGGMTIDNERIVRELEAANQEVPAELLPQTNEEGQEEEPDSWSISLDQDLPCSLTFKDGNARVAVRCRSLTQYEETDGGRPKGTTITDAIELAATYRLTAPNGNLRADRIGDVEIKFVESPPRLSSTQIAYKTFLMRKIGSLFRDSFSIDDLPEDENTRRLRDVKLRQFASNDGWLALGVDIPPGMIAEMRASQPR